MKFKLHLLFLLLFLNISAFSQKNLLRNPSFEDTARHSHPPREWIDMGFEGETPVDVHPGSEFGVVKKAKDGDTYLGMVVRDNDTWECVRQDLSTPLQAGKKYSLKIFLARSDTYISISQLNDKQANYNTGAMLRIHGGRNGRKLELLAKTEEIITHPKWEEYTFEFTPGESYTQFFLEVFYSTPTLFPYNGNVLLDDARLYLID